ncbi:hypothetical protein POTOM_060283 [Populus tomentosa]|uniref:Retrovirus-related Pol polyprotein from transposon TNT 1-94-like beta-barrel domain-containing protein n=1 Tax=Populus tomentosa TaxID=118781 RepID=A0A8X8BVY5_POPTO|nr:hypothetical protein POTOM_060283 [Populus tomentosa]
MKRYMQLSTSKEIWDPFTAAYFDENDEAIIHSLNRKASHLCQNSQPLATYFEEITEIFQELDHFNRVSMKCENDIKMFQKYIERQQVYIFLGGLDDKFDQIHGEVLRKDPPLGLQTSYAHVRREADKKEAMKMEVDKSEPAAMAAKTQTRKDSDQIANKASAMVAATGRDGKALSTSTSVMNNTWIIDSRATEHMTCDSKQVLSLKTSAQTEVNVANGNVIPVIGEGTISLTDTMKLNIEEYRSSEVLTQDNTKVLTFDYSLVARNELYEEQPLQSSRLEYTTPREEQQSIYCGDQATKKLTKKQQTLQEEEHPTGPIRLGLDNELQPITYNKTE